jgi:hypothetical protein
VDPELGAKGNLLKRMVPSNYTNCRGYYNDTDFLGMVNALTSPTRPVQMQGTNGHTSGNMLGLGFLEVAMKDIVHPKYNTSQNISIPDENGTIWQYPALQWQNNTGNSYVAKQFENTATAVIDLGPLYDYAVQNGSYLNGAPAITYWNNTHHMSKQFLVVLRVYWRFHNYVARGLEEYFWIQNSWSGGLTTSVSNPSVGAFSPTWVFNQAKRSTIRFSQAVLEQAALQILLDSPNSTVQSYWEPTFDSWLYRDGDQPYGDGWFGLYKAKVRDGYEFNRTINRANFTQYLASEATLNYMTHFLLTSGDLLLSLRNPNFNTTRGSLLSSWDTTNCDHLSSNAASSLGYDVLSLQYTPLQRFGSGIHPYYTKDLKVLLYRGRELGLGPYSAYVSQLTNAANSSSPPNCTDLTQAQRDADVYYQMHLESNPSRQYRYAMASVAFSAMSAVNDVLLTDRTSLWGKNSAGVWTGGSFHPDPNYFDVLPTFEFLNCYPGEDPWGYGCDPTSINAAASILGYHPDMGNYDADCNLDENNYYARSLGSLFSHPTLLFYQNREPVGWPDFTMRQFTTWAVFDEFMNAIFYQHDGLETLAVKQPVGQNYLPVQLVDAFAVNIAWNHPAWEGLCYNPDLVNPSFACSKPLTCEQYYSCYWMAAF